MIFENRASPRVKYSTLGFPPRKAELSSAPYHPKDPGDSPLINTECAEG